MFRDDEDSDSDDQDAMDEGKASEPESEDEEDILHSVKLFHRTFPPRLCLYVLHTVVIMFDA